MSLPLGPPTNTLTTYPNGNRNFGSGIEEGTRLGSGGIDLFGAIMRRKFIIILACLLGALIGYLNFAKEAPSYSSWLKLMIWEQAPPSVVDGEWIQRRVAVTKHQNLLGSELVLSSAVENGELQNLPTFVGSASPVSKLKSMLNISSVSQNDDTLILVCNGPVAEDLPVILNQVVQAYQLILSDDSKSVGEESIALVEKLQKKLLREKKEAEERYLELSSLIGPVASDADDKISNPHLLEMKLLQNERLKYIQELKSIEQQLRLVRDVAYDSDADLKQLLIMEANKYLNVDPVSQQIGKKLTRQDFLLQRIGQFEDLVVQKNLDRQNVNPGIGNRHPQYIAVESQITYLRNAIKLMKSELSRLREDDKQQSSTGEEIIEHRNDQLIGLYSASLLLKQKQLLESITAFDQQIVEEESKASEVANAVVEINLLRSRIEEKGNAIQIIFDRLAEIDLVSSDYDTVRVRTIDTPGIGRQVSPVLSKSIGYATFLASLIGLALALLIDRLDLTFRTSTEIAENLGYPVIGTIPRIRQKKVSEFEGAPVLSTAHRPHSRVSESFRAVRTALFFAGENGNKNSFLFTSPSPGDGKSTITSNLAISIAQTGKRVCLVDADFRRPMLQSLFNSDREEGILDVMSGNCTLFEAIASTDQHDLFILGTGGRSESPGEVVTTPEFSAIIDELRKEFDFVLIDSPPIGPVADASVISRMVDSVYLVLRIRKGVRVSSANAVDNLLQVEADLKGIIVNDLDENPHYNDYGYHYSPYSGYSRYGYGYGYGYGTSGHIADGAKTTAKQG